MDYPDSNGVRIHFHSRKNPISDPPTLSLDRESLLAERLACSVLAYIFPGRGSNRHHPLLGF